ncbi:MAG: chemotaxis protein CheW [Oscillospiraceae bacterium]
MNNTNTQTEQQIDTSEMDGKYLTFWTDKQLFGVPIAHVVQIVGMQNITEVPEFPYYAKGIINLRGSIIPLIDARLRLGKAEAEYNERTCVIVTSINEHFVGFIVDEVDAVVTIADDLIVPPPRLDANTDSYITGVGKLGDKVVLLMDTRKIVGVEDLEILTASETAV